VTQIFKKFPAFYRTGGSLPYLQQPATGSSPEPDASNPHLPTLYRKIHTNIIFPYTPRSSEWTVPFVFAGQNFVCISHLSRACYTFRRSRTPWFYHPDITWCYRLKNILYWYENWSPVL